MNQIMDIQREDILSVFLTLGLLFIWFITLIVLNYPLLSISFLWTGMIVLSLVYVWYYRKKKRNMVVLKLRFFVSALPIYPALGIYVYLLLNGQEVTGIFRFLPIGIIGTMLILNASVVYVYSLKQQ